jgi:hypothetical protein
MRRSPLQIVLRSLRQDCRHSLFSSFNRFRRSRVLDSQSRCYVARTGDVLKQQHQNLSVSFIQHRPQLSEKHRSFHCDRCFPVDSNPLLQFGPHTHGNLCPRMFPKPSIDLALEGREGITPRRFDQRWPSRHRFSKFFGPSGNRSVIHLWVLPHSPLECIFHRISCFCRKVFPVPINKMQECPAHKSKSTTRTK